MKTYDVVALGELLIDFTENGRSDAGNTIFEANPGGAPCNVLAMLNKWGKRTAFIGKVGKDSFGEQLKEVLIETGIDVRNLVFDDKIPTTLAFVHTHADGDRTFSFYRSPGADVLLKKEEVMEEVIASAKLFHFGTLSLTQEPVRSATRYAVETAKKKGCLISFDPNLREPLWESLEDAKQEMIYGIKNCDILKISDNEVEFLTGTEDYAKGVEIIREIHDIPLIFVTLGKQGSQAYYKDIIADAKPFIREDTIETTGAGDTFEGCALNYILDCGLENLDKEKLEELLMVANAGASIITSRKGALRVMPEPKEICQIVDKMNEVCGRKYERNKSV